MKKIKYFPFYFLFYFCFFIISQKFNFVIRGTPIGGHSWNQIWEYMPVLIILAAIFALCTNYGVNSIMKQKIADTIEAKKRIEEREKYYSASSTHECRVCGCYSEDFPWGEEGKSPSFQICPCCGVQFGKEDRTLESIKTYRAEWRNSGGKWFMENEKPESWDIEQQMKNIPDEFK